MQSDPHERNGSWYFYDETGDEYGPYDNKAVAEAAMILYAHWLETNEQYEVIRNES